MSYRTDQFYNLVQKGIIPNDDFLSPDSYSNPEFIWPGRTRKHSVDGNWVDKNNIQRGFIRLLTNTNEAEANFQVPTSLKNRRCFFQFNPSTIVRNVSMNSVGMMNPLLQDPSQFSAPIPGNAGFAFELMFDRSFELAKGSGGATPDTPGAPGSSVDPFLANDPLLTASPNTVGVLADLRVLDAIIGQGLTQDMIDFMRYRAELVSSWQTSDTYVDVSTPSTEEGADGTTTTSTTTSTSSTDSGAAAFDEDQFNISANRNIGNQAFLIPNPVRVLFSSLFMVDGYVTDMSVTFVKFNEAMVPMQCMVAVQMQAVYIGFAKKETFLTYSLNEAVKRDIATIDSTVDNTVNQEQRNITVDILNAHLKRFRIIPSDSIDTSTWWGGSNTSWERSGPKVLSAEDFRHVENDDYLTGDLYSSNEVAFPAITGNESIYWNYGFEQPVPEDGEEVDGIVDAFVTEQIKSISYSFTLKFYRLRGLGPNETDPEDVGPHIDPTNSNRVYLGSVTSPPELIARTPEEWINIRKVNGLTKEEGSLLPLINDYSQEWGRASGITVVNISQVRVETPSLFQIKEVWNTSYSSYLNRHKPFHTELEVTVAVEDIAGNTIVGTASGRAVHNYNTQIVNYKTITFEKIASTPDSSSGSDEESGTSTRRTVTVGSPTRTFIT